MARKSTTTENAPAILIMDQIGTPGEGTRRGGDRAKMRIAENAQNSKRSGRGKTIPFPSSLPCVLWALCGSQEWRAVNAVAAGRARGSSSPGPDPTAAPASDRPARPAPSRPAARSGWPAVSPGIQGKPAGSAPDAASLCPNAQEQSLSADAAPDPAPPPAGSLQPEEWATSGDRQSRSGWD